MRINTNVASINAQKNLWNTQQAQSRSMDKLSSGFRINRAGDDAAGLGIANQLRADNRSLQQAFRNAEQGNSVLQIAEGSTSTIQKMLERMKELATQSASDTVDGTATEGGRARLSTEFNELRDEIDRIVGSTKFQGQELVSGDFAAGGTRGPLTFQIGSDSGADSQLQISLGDLRAEALGLRGNGSSFDADTSVAGVTVDGSFTGMEDVTVDIRSVSLGGDPETFGFEFSTDGENWTAVAANTDGDFAFEIGGVTFDLGSTAPTAAATIGQIELSADTGLGSREAALDTMDRIDEALGNVNAELGNIGAYQNRLEYTMANLKTSIQNNAAAESVIRDLDMAEEMTNFSKLGILSQAGQAMLAQANQSTQGVLQLLHG
jgi:flagellin